MNGTRSDVIVLTGGSVYDGRTDEIKKADVVVRDGMVAGTGAAALEAEAEGALVIELDDTALVVPGIVDLHVHTFGGLAFADPDSIGVNLGSTVVCDAGGAGTATWDEFADGIGHPGTTTQIFSWLYLNQSGIAESLVGRDDAADPLCLLDGFDVPKIVNLVRKNDRIRGIKLPIFGFDGDVEMVKLAKATATLAGTRLYVHVGDHLGRHPRNTPELVRWLEQSLDVLGPGDIVTHCYTANPSNLQDVHGSLLEAALEAQERGVLFDVGFGGYNFDFGVAERLWSEGLVPATVSSDLQQVNITGPTFSLPYVMSCMSAVGFELADVVRMVTVHPAQVMGVEEDGLSEGRRARLSVLRVERDGTRMVRDTSGNERRADAWFESEGCVVGDQWFATSWETAADQRNWSLLDAIESRAARTGGPVPEELRAAASGLIERLSAVRAEDWNGPVLCGVIDCAAREAGVRTRDVGRLVLQHVLDPVFPMSAGYLLARVGREDGLAALTRETA